MLLFDSPAKANPADFQKSEAGPGDVVLVDDFEDTKSVSTKIEAETAQLDNRRAQVQVARERRRAAVDFLKKALKLRYDGLLNQLSTDVSAAVDVHNNRTHAMHARIINEIRAEIETLFKQFCEDTARRTVETEEAIARVDLESQKRIAALEQEGVRPTIVARIRENSEKRIDDLLNTINGFFELQVKQRVEQLERVTTNFLLKR